MTTQWDRFAARAGQTIRDLGGENALELRNGSATFDTERGGHTTSYPDSADATVDAETAAPSAVSGIDDGGTFEGIDQLAWVDDDPPIEIVPYGDTDDPPTRVTVLENGETFEVQSTTQTGDGYVRLDMTEI
jgi:hypothetical protein